MKYLLDTNVYVEATRSLAGRVRFRAAFLPLLPATFLSAVVAYELSINARNQRTRDLVDELVRPMQRTGRIVAPTFEDWAEAGRVVSAIWVSDKPWRSKLPAILNDILIALCARRVGATLLTRNRDDFRLIRRHLNFVLRILEVS